MTDDHLPSPEKGRENRWWLSLCAILGLTFLVYVPSLSNGFTNWDDNSYVTRNPLLAAPTFKAVLLTSVYGNYSPLTIWSLALNYAISRDNPASYHWLNLILHLLNTALVFAFVRKLSAGRFWTTVVTAVFFGVHPMHVESVAWIAERKDVLYAFFYLIGLVLYLRYLDTKRPLWLATVFIAFVLAMASKPAAAVFPLTLVAIDYFKKRPMRPAALLEKLPFLAVSVLGGLLTVHAQVAIGALERNLHYSLFSRVLFACYGLAMYVVKMFVPTHLSAVYPIPKTATDALGWELYLALVTVAALLPALLVAFRRRPAVIFGLAFFIINLVLVLQVVAVGTAILADRFTYLPYIGLFFGLSWWLDEPEPLPAAQGRLRTTLCAALLLLLPACLFATWNRCAVWRSSESLWNDVIRKYPRTIPIAYNNRGEFYRTQGRLREALADYDQALALSSSGHALLWLSRADVLFDLRRMSAAVASYDSALVLMLSDKALDRSSGLAYPFNKRGSARLQLGDFRGAIEDFSRSLELRPDDPIVYGTRGLAYEGLQEREKALADWRRAVALAPHSPNNHFYFNEIGLALQKLDRQKEAIESFTQAINSPPDDPRQMADYYRNRSLSWRSVGRPDRALEDTQKAQRLTAAQKPAHVQPIASDSEPGQP